MIGDLGCGAIAHCVLSGAVPHLTTLCVNANQVKRGSTALSLWLIGAFIAASVVVVVVVVECLVRRCPFYYSPIPPNNAALARRLVHGKYFS